MGNSEVASPKWYETCRKSFTGIMRPKRFSGGVIIGRIIIGFNCSSGNIIPTMKHGDESIMFCMGRDWEPAHILILFLCGKILQGFLSSLKVLLQICQNP